jgi:hypothetical protein
VLLLFRYFRVTLTSSISTTMKIPKNKKRKRGNNPILDGDVRLAHSVRPQVVTKTKKDGSIVKNRVWISMDNPPPNVTATSDSNTTNMPASDSEYDENNTFLPEEDSNPQPGRTQNSRVSLYHRY